MKNYLLIFLMAVAMVACTENVKDDDGVDGAGADDTAVVDGQSGAQVGAVDGAGADAGQALAVSYDAAAINDANSVLAERVIYFDFDISKVDGDYVELVKHHGKYLSANPSVKIRLEGHADERGTREYNVALADRRAQAVKRLLMFQGASSDQITLISYGEEKPASLGHDEASWRLNRRAELVYQ
ncbi:MAG: peptidoglycan-associated lipoprotein Pal [Gammaproteobacteria bacterium]|nr:peptidoglycan-associated lipoprotein Pal [Gammaproteobacteria bacterium]MCW8922326.1 peptidoglycan-associated lipoprotein Pal [Gammaproteobacteria bacterium]